MYMWYRCPSFVCMYVYMLCMEGGGGGVTGLGSFLPFFRSFCTLSTSVLHTCIFMYDVYIYMYMYIYMYVYKKLRCFSGSVSWGEKTYMYMYLNHSDVGFQSHARKLDMIP